MRKQAVQWVAVAALGGVVFFGLGMLGAGAGSSETEVHRQVKRADVGEEAKMTSEEKDVTELLASGEALFVDVRTPQEYAQNGLEGAINIPVQEMTLRMEEFGDRERPVVVYCRTGNRSSHAKRILEQYGFEDVRDLGGHGAARRAVQEAQRR